MKEGIEASLLLMQGVVLFAAIWITLITLRNFIITAGYITDGTKQFAIGVTIYWPTILWTLLFLLLKTSDDIVVAIIKDTSNGI